MISMFGLPPPAGARSLISALPRALTSTATIEAATTTSTLAGLLARDASRTVSAKRSRVGCSTRGATKLGRAVVASLSVTTGPAVWVQT
jgi:hypothetical protein